MLLLLFALAALARAAPNLLYPLMTQQPPVARIGKPFIFDLFPMTFNSTSDIAYSTSALPSWLAFDAPTLTFNGTPPPSNASQTDITLTATDASGSTASNFTLIVTNYSSPAVHRAFTSQITNSSLRAFASATALPGGTGVSVPPYWSFSLGFASDTFRNSLDEPNNGELYFAAHLRGSVGLPSWLMFDNETFTFNAVAPASGSYSVVVTGTDFWGYSAALSSFVIEVGTGEPVEIAKGQNLTDVMTMARSEVAYTVDLSDILLGGKAVTGSDVVVSIDNTNFPWLSYNSATNTLNGTTPDRYQNGTTSPLSLPITIASINTSNTLSLATWLGINVAPSYFSSFSINATANPSKPFSFDLSSYLQNNIASANPSKRSVLGRSTLAQNNLPTVNATVTPTEAAQWLMFYPGNLTLIGMPPSNPQYSKVGVIFEAALDGMTSTADLTVTLAGVTPTSSSNSTASAAVPTGDAASSSHGISTGAKIALGVVFGIVGLIALLLLLFCCCRRRRKSNKEEKEKDDSDSFVACSPVPVQDPFRRSNGLDPPRNLLGEIARFSGFNLPASGDTKPKRDPAPPVEAMAATRIGGLKGIFGWVDEKDKPNAMLSPRLPSSSASFLGSGDVIGVNDPVNRPSQDASSFTQSFDSSESSRASWESQASFRWSSAENEGGMGRNRESMTPSIPRPRETFTPRYPRNASPTALARLASQHTLEASPEFSEFGSEADDSQSGTFASDSLAGSRSFPSGPTGLGRFGDSGFKSIDEDDEDTTSMEGPAVVSRAERQSVKTRRPQASGSQNTPKLRPSRERITSPKEAISTEQSNTALAGEEGMYDDADEARRSTVYAPSDAAGPGYPASSIFFGSPNPDSEYDARSSMQPSEARTSTIRAIPSHTNPLSPPLPQVGSFIRHRRTNTSGSAGGSRTGISEGRLIACANETFSIHPPIHPPPTVSLSAATWSSNPPSTYRAEVQGGGPLPAWLHFDARELELWGVPSLKHAGETTVIRIVEKLGNGNRRSDPMSYGYEPPQEREVGRTTIEVVDRLRSPQFALDGSPHAM